MKRGIALLLVLLLTVSLSACSAAEQKEGQTGTQTGALQQEKNPEGKTVNIAVTDVFSTVNPLNIGSTEVVKYSLSLEFLPFVELNEDVEFVGQLADEITTEDNIHYTIHLNEKASWSDGEPVTADDVLFTFQLLASPEVGGSGMMLYAIEGIGDDGYLAPGTEEISGIRKVDEKTVEITLKWEVALYTFENNFGRYILTLPEHILRDTPKEELLTSDWFNAPDVVSGPYFLKEYDLNHYEYFKANENYWQGAPKIQNLNINVLTPSQLLVGLQSGEIDLIQQTTSNILQEDYASVEALEGITVYDGTPVTIQNIFINTQRVPDVRIRQALLYGIDRNTIREEFLNGRGEVIDGFLASAGPYYDEGLGVTEYDPDKAAALVAEAVADGADNQLSFYVNSGDTTFAQVASYISARLAEIGLNVEVKTFDLSTLLGYANNYDFDLFAVQYTYAPVDPYSDIVWILSADGWCRYEVPEVAEALTQTQVLTELEQITAQYRIVDEYTQREVPAIPVYVISALGVTSDRLQNANPNVFGTFINVHEWEIVE